MCTQTNSTWGIAVIRVDLTWVRWRLLWDVGESGTGGDLEFGEQPADAAFDLVADRADVVDVEAAGSSSTQSS